MARRSAAPPPVVPLRGDGDKAGKANVLVSFGTAVMFLTRLPVGRYCSADPAELARATRWFPLVGLLVGLALAMVWTATEAIAPSSMACLATLIAGALITGAFHEDGLADVADSAGAFDVDAKLNIMRDSRVGTYGALALVLLVLSRFVILWELSVLTIDIVIAALVCAHVLARWSSVLLMARVPYARGDANNRVVAEGVGSQQLMEATLMALLIVLPMALLGDWRTVWALPAALIVTLLAGWRFRRRLGGITGDCLGAVNVIVELSVMSIVLIAASG